MQVFAGGNNQSSGTTKAAAAAPEANFNPTGYPIVKNNITLTAAARLRPAHTTKFEDMIFMKQVMAKTNITLNITSALAGSGLDEKRNLMFASNDLPDFFFPTFGLWDRLSEYGQLGQLIPMEGLIDKYGDNIKKIWAKFPKAKANSYDTISGHIYATPQMFDMPYTPASDDLFINKRWLDALGLPVPTTIDEFTNDLRAFKKMTPEQSGYQKTILFTFRNQDVQNNFEQLYAAFGAPYLYNGPSTNAQPSYMGLKDGKPYFIATTPEFKAATQWLRTLAQEGLLDIEAFTHTAAEFTAKTSNPDVGIGSFVCWSVENAMGVGKPNDYYAFIPVLQGPAGKVQRYMDRSFARGAGFAISGKNQHPEATMRLIDYFYDDEIGIQAAYGDIGTHIEKIDDNHYRFMPTPAGIAYNTFRFSQAFEEWWVNWDKLQFNDSDAQKVPRFQQKVPYFAPYYPNVQFSPEQSQARSTLATDIENYVQQMQAKWIVQGGIENEWDAYVAKINDMGLDKLMQIYNDAYQQYLKFSQQ